MIPNNGKSVKGECECCPAVDVMLTSRNGMMMCADCVEKEKAVEKTVNSMIVESRTIDSNITLKTDVFLARTVAATELRGAIEADETIPADQKEYAYARECMTRFQNLQRVIFEERQALLEKENELRMWQVNVQTSAGKLREEKRAEFKSLDISYQPTVVKSIKPKAVKAPSSKQKFDRVAVADAAKKYNVPAAAVQMMVVSRNGMSPEAAAKELASKL